MKTLGKLITTILIIILILGSFVLGGYFGIKSQTEETLPPGEQPHVHKFSEEWRYDKTNHYHACGCGTVRDMAAHTFENGICTICGAEEPEPPHEHTYSAEWSYNEQYHFHASTCGHNIISNATPHSMENGICVVCGYADHEHEYDEPLSNRFWHYYECRICGYVSGIEGHEYGDGVTCKICGRGILAT